VRIDDGLPVEGKSSQNVGTSLPAPSLIMAYIRCWPFETGHQLTASIQPLPSTSSVFTIRTPEWPTTTGASSGGFCWAASGERGSEDQTPDEGAESDRHGCLQR
jgi:hypothetical protein